MKVMCPQCEAVYQIDDARIPNEGIHGRCPKCNERFFIRKENTKAAETKQKVVKKKQGMSVIAKIFSILIAIILGFLSGVLIYFGAVFIFHSPGTNEISGWFVFITFFGGWIASTFLMFRKAKSISKVFSRGFLIGAAEWFAMIPITMFFSGRAAVETAGGSDPAATVGAVIGGGLLAFMGTGLCLTMMIICLFGFVISFLLSRELKPENS